uniref:Uncharacterized protein n=1 Tax=Meloidogyne incognita TaxID=6306 RepID=A0A914LBV8_MELIC
MKAFSDFESIEAVPRRACLAVLAETGLAVFEVREVRSICSILPVFKRLSGRCIPLKGRPLAVRGL